jgi:hypothetical protein
MAKQIRRKIDEEALSDALDRHTEALFKRRAGSDATPFKHDPDAAEMFRLSKQVYETMRPVEPSDAFVDDLKIKLLEMHATQPRRNQIKVQAKPNWARIFTIAGIAAQILAPIVMILAFILTRRRKSATSAASAA